MLAFAVVKCSTVYNLTTIVCQSARNYKTLSIVVLQSVVTHTEASCLRFLKDKKYAVNVAGRENTKKNLFLSTPLNNSVHQFVMFNPDRN